MSTKKKTTKKDADGFQSKLEFGYASATKPLEAIVKGVKLIKRSDAFENSQYGEPDDILVAVKIEIAEGTEFVHYMKAPKPDVPLNPQSNFAKWVKGYGGAPEAKQSVVVTMGANGYYQVVL